MFKLKKLFSLLLSIIVLFSHAYSPPLAIAYYNQASASDYLRNHSSSAWSTLGLVALNSESIPYDHLKNINASSAIEYEAPILAISALGMDPNNFFGQNYIAKLKSYYTAGQLGDPSTLNDDIFGLLALIAAGTPQTDEVVIGIKNFISSNQNPDGGWSFNVGGSSDTNITAVALVALSALGTYSNDTSVQSALNYLRSAQNPDGGITYDPQSAYGTDSDSSSTSWVLWALNSLNIDQSLWSKNGKTPKDYITSTQTQTGYFEYQTGAGENSFSPITTSYAVIALSGKTLPVRPQISITESFKYRIEGSNQTVCAGKAQGPTALDIIKNASATCGFTYHIKQASFGAYLNKINDDQASGQTGWMYLINNTYADVGAADYYLKTGEEVIWFFGDYGWQPTRLELAQTKIESGQNVQTKIEYYNGSTWQNLPGATVVFGAMSATTNDEGIASISAPDGYYSISAHKMGFIRSQQILLQIGDPSSSSINLSANLDNGDIQGTSTKPSTLSFVVNTSNLNFGQIKPGDVITKEVSIINNGTVNLNIGCIVTGDRIFSNYLKINGTTWQKFSTSLESNQNQNQTLKLAIPTGLDETSGYKTGQLVFWASTN